MKMTSENVRKLRSIGPLAMASYHKGCVEDNNERIIPSRFNWFDFNGLILEGAAKAGHVVLFSGQNGDGDQAYIKRKDGTILGVEGINAEEYSKNPNGYKTQNPEWYGWSPNFGGWENNNTFLS